MGFITTIGMALLIIYFSINTYYSFSYSLYLYETKSEVPIDKLLWGAFIMFFFGLILKLYAKWWAE